MQTWIATVNLLPIYYNNILTPVLKPLLGIRLNR